VAATIISKQLGKAAAQVLAIRHLMPVSRVAQPLAGAPTVQFNQTHRILPGAASPQMFQKTWTEAKDNKERPPRVNDKISIRGLEGSGPRVSESAGFIVFSTGVQVIVLSSLSNQHKAAMEVH
jgi:hypothetical protein